MAKRRPKGTGSIRNRGTARHPRYFARYEVAGGDGRQWVTEGPFRVKADAEEWLAAELARKRQGRTAVPGRVTYAEVLAEWLTVIRPRLSPNTWEEYERAVRLRLVPHLGHHRVRDLRPGHIAQMYEAMRLPGANKHSRKAKRSLSETTLSNTHSALNASLAWAVRQGLAAHNPAGDVVRPRPADTEMQVWTADELGRFLAAVAEDRLFPLWQLAAATGMRRSELLGQQWADVDLDAATVAVRRARVVVKAGMHTKKRTKSQRGTRVVDIDPATVTALRRWRAAQKAERLSWGPAYTATPWVFTRTDGEPLRARFVTGRWEKAVEAATGVPVIRLHDVRHTHASLLLAAGVPPVDVAARIGDSLETLLRTYAHVIPGRGHQAAAEFARILGD